jgi:uncharacterized damage-inducible protein DinB
MTAQEARTLVRYSGWASRKVLEAALARSPEDRAKLMSVSHESIAKTLTHIYFADAIWYSRIVDPGYPVPSHDALPSLDFVVEEWPRLHRGQIVGMFRQLGVKPPATDIVFLYYEQTEAPQS